MATLYPELNDRLIRFILRQPVFFVATAPCLDQAGNGGHVNVSPKGYKDTFAVIDPLTVAYLDLTGSGAETVAHLRQNGRITIMFCSFERAPKILRIYGCGRAVRPGDREWDDLAGRFAGGPGFMPGHADGAGGPGGPGRPAGTGWRNQRAIIVVSVDRVADSCGYSVPVMELVEERDVLMRDAERRSADELVAYHDQKNSVSIDGLPALG
jgi:Pyridoxamine 5'-phosphate oxidase